MDAMDLIARTLAMPHTHKVTTLFADGRERIFTTRNLASAESFAERERGKIGRDLICRETGATVRVIGVTVAEIK